MLPFKRKIFYPSVQLAPCDNTASIRNGADDSARDDGDIISNRYYTGEDF